LRAVRKRGAGAKATNKTCGVASARNIAPLAVARGISKRLLATLKEEGAISSDKLPLARRGRLAHAQRRQAAVAPQHNPPGGGHSSHVYRAAGQAWHRHYKPLLPTFNAVATLGADLRRA